MCHQIIPVWYRSATMEQLEIWGHVYLVQWSTKQSPWSYQRPELESPYGAVHRRLTSSVPEHYSRSPADLCQRKEPCWACITSGTVTKECLYPASGHRPASSRAMSLTHPLPFRWWGNAGRALQAPWLSHPNLEGLLESWVVSLGPFSFRPIHYCQNCPSLIISFLCIHFFCKQVVNSLNENRQELR